MAHYVLICAVALCASGLTFFSGFGLGTLLLPAFAVFFPIDVAIALTAIVHFLNGVFKLVLVGRHVNVSLALRFGIPAVLSALAGARMLAWLSDLRPLGSYELGGRSFAVMPIKLLVAVLMVGFAVAELSPRFKKIAVPPRYLPLGGLVTGFFGGLSGHQGAFRSAFLIRAGLDKQAFVATGVAISAAIDVSRISAYATRLTSADLAQHRSLLVAATAAAFAGAFLGNRLLQKITLRTIEASVAVMLIVIAVALGSGLI